MNIAELISAKPPNHILQDLAIDVATHPEMVDDLAALIFGGNEHQAFRASYVLTSASEKNPTLLNNFHYKLLEQYFTFKHNGIRRNILRCYMFSDFPAEVSGMLADISFKAMNDADEMVGVRANAMSVLERVCKIEPELCAEVELYLNQYSGSPMPALASRSKNILKNMQKRIHGS